jgi:hypothetical protein
MLFQERNKVLGTRTTRFAGLQNFQLNSVPISRGSDQEHARRQRRQHDGRQDGQPARVNGHPPSGLWFNTFDDAGSLSSLGLWWPARERIASLISQFTLYLDRARPQAPADS